MGEGSGFLRYFCVLDTGEGDWAKRTAITSSLGGE